MRKRNDHRRASVRPLARWARRAAAVPPDGRGKAPDEFFLSLPSPGGRGSLAPRWAVQRRAAEARALRRGQRRRDELTERLAELELAIERQRATLAELEARATAPVFGEIEPLPSAYGTVQGLRPEDPLAVVKRRLLRELLRRNVEMRRGRHGA